MTATVVRQTDINLAYRFIALASGVSTPNTFKGAMYTEAIAKTANLVGVDPDQIAEMLRHLVYTTPPGEHEDYIHPTELTPYIRGLASQDTYLQLFVRRQTTTVDTIEAMFNIGEPKQLP